MFRYRKVAAFQGNPVKHVTMLDNEEVLRQEDISFYGLLTFSVTEIKARMQLPGLSSFTFTDRDRAIIRRALSEAGVKSFESELEVCTLADDGRDELVQSDLYRFSGKSQHGLQIVEHTLGVCSIGWGVTAEQQD